MHCEPTSDKNKARASKAKQDKVKKSRKRPLNTTNALATVATGKNHKAITANTNPYKIDNNLFIFRTDYKFNPSPASCVCLCFTLFQSIWYVLCDFIRLSSPQLISQFSIHFANSTSRITLVCSFVSPLDHPCRVCLRVFCNCVHSAYYVAKCNHSSKPET